MTAAHDNALNRPPVTRSARLGGRQVVRPGAAVIYC